MLTELDDTGVDAGQHVVQFYEREENLALAVSSFLGAGLVAGETALVVATAAHREALDAVLAAAGIDVRAARATGQYRTFDARAVLDTFLVDGEPDAARFTATVGALVEQVSASGAPVRIYGEMVALLWDQGAVAAAIALEGLWNDLGRRTPFTLFCGYPLEAVAGTLAGLNAICEHHSAIVAEPERQPVRPWEVTRRFEPTTLAGPLARRFVTDTLIAWGKQALVEITSLVVSELVGNAIRHGGQRFEVTVCLQGNDIRVTVTDGSPLPPTLRQVNPGESTDGRGMHLIDVLAHRWGTRLHDGGKTVWAVIDGSAS